MVNEDTDRVLSRMKDQLGALTILLKLEEELGSKTCQATPRTPPWFLETYESTLPIGSRSLYLPHEEAFWEGKSWYGSVRKRGKEIDGGSSVFSLHVSIIYQI